MSGNPPFKFNVIARDTARFFSEVIKTEPMLKQMALESLLESIKDGDQEIAEVETKFKTGADAKFIVKYASTAGSKKVEQVCRYFIVILYKTRRGSPKVFVTEGNSDLCPPSPTPVSKQKNPKTPKPVPAVAETCTFVDLEDAKKMIKNHFKVPQPVPSSKGSPQKGDHVINNKVTNIFAGIIDQFIQEQYGFQNLDDMLKQRISSVGKGKAKVEDITEKLSQDYKTPINEAANLGKIQNTVVHFNQGDRKLPDVNSTLYGLSVQVLTAKVVEYLKILTKEPEKADKHGPCRQKVKLIVDIMNIGGVYVDEEALKEFISGTGSNNKKNAVLEATAQSYIETVKFMLSKLGDETTLKAWVQNINELVSIPTESKAK